MEQRLLGAAGSDWASCPGHLASHWKSGLHGLGRHPPCSRELCKRRQGSGPWRLLVRDLWLSTLASEQFWRGVVPFGVLSSLYRRQQPSRGLDSAAHTHTHTHTRVTVIVTPVLTPGRGNTLQLRPGSGLYVTSIFNTHLSSLLIVWGWLRGFTLTEQVGYGLVGGGAALQLADPHSQPPLPLYISGQPGAAPFTPKSHFGGMPCWPSKVQVPAGDGGGGELDP